MSEMENASNGDALGGYKGDPKTIDSSTPSESRSRLPDEVPGEPASDVNDTKTTIAREQVFVVGCVLVTELCERLTFYSVVANMVLFCTSMLDYTSDDASVVTLVFTGTTFIMPVFGGFIADTVAGKFHTILGLSLVYILGLILLTTSAINYPAWFSINYDIDLDARKALFFSGLVLINLGIGGMKANLGAFGAQQVKDLGLDAVQSFFNWNHWFNNVGGFIAFSGVAYVQQEIGFDYGFLIPLISMVFGLLVFLVAKGKYKHTEQRGSILRPSLGVCLQSCSGCPNPTYDRARKDNGGRYDNEMVDGVRAVMRILPIFAMLVVYWAVYSQMGTSLFLQSERLDISVGDTKLPVAALTIFNTLMVIILIPIMDRGVYPFLAKIGKSPTDLQRIGIGMVLAICSMLYAGILEIVRKDDIEKHGYIEQTLSDDKFNASKLSMFAQIPEFAFIGASEVFTAVSGVEFAYTQAPEFMQGLIIGLFYMTAGIGNYVASAIVALVKSWRKDEASDWFPTEPNNGHLEYMLFMLAVLTTLNMVVFIVVAMRYKRKAVDAKEEGQNDPQAIHTIEFDANVRETVTEKRVAGPESTKL